MSNIREYNKGLGENTVFSQPLVFRYKKTATQAVTERNGQSGDRTLDTRIKSPVLCQLS